MKKEIFVTGIGTDVGKTVASAILCNSIGADYWKPIQAGDLENSDSIKINQLSPKTVIHPESYRLNTPASPHWAAELDRITVNSKTITRPKTNNPLLIEGAGGLLVPINDIDTIASLIQPTDYVILISRHYLGSINHTLLSLAYLDKIKCEKVGILFLGEETRASEEIIRKKTSADVIGRIEHTEKIDSFFIENQAKRIHKELKAFIE